MNSHQHHPGEQGPAEDQAPTGEDLAALLTRVLEEAGMTQKDLAEKAGVSYPTLNSWIKRTRGTSRVAPETLRSIASAVSASGVKLTPREVFAAAGRPVPGPTDAEREARLLKLYRQLPEDKQRDLVRYAEAALKLSHASPG
ncbi:helix-turn-helix domain-containing protein [Streptomyces musisoli]|uniref:helix-turn-helix domain-containing protein n=1 Tax=Streptomyces musisoli TaxID=2802280 RepID=UPI0027DAA059|nr:helix-turn-helix domain-containing protein [Streptomyces musisoli]